MDRKAELTLADVTSRLRYDHDTGRLFWIVNSSKNVKAGSEAGCIKASRKNAEGGQVSYRYVRIMGVEITSAQIAWFISHGVWPTGRLYYKDKDTLNTAIDNLYMSHSVDEKYDFNEVGANAAYLREHRRNHPLVWKETYLQKSFGIGLGEYGKMLVAQSGKCAICGEEETESRNGEVKALAVDHDHKTGKLRGLLCTACNQGIGKFKESRDVLLAAIAYLDKHSTEGSA